MKDKVKQLAEEAGFILWNNEEWKPEGQVVDWFSDYDKELEKFAQLIVRECLEACSRANEIRHFVPPTQEQVVLSCMREIEQHFGVEE